jgi:hypothetical protein
MHGGDVGRPDFADLVLVLAPGEQIWQVFGTGVVFIESIGFVTTLGRTLGPVGSGNNGPWTVYGITTGFFGGDLWGTVGAIGVYTNVSGRAPYPTSLGLSVGDYGATGWDDGLAYPGAAQYRTQPLLFFPQKSRFFLAITVSYGTQKAWNILSRQIGPKSSDTRVERLFMPTTHQLLS